MQFNSPAVLAAGRRAGPGALLRARLPALRDIPPLQADRPGEIARVQYGINFRQPDGRTYSAPDEPGDGPTRNLGIVMEGASDAEATAVARQTAEFCGIAGMNAGTGVHGLAFADATGTVTADLTGAALSSNQPYARSLGRFARTVTLRYRVLLADLSPDPADAHGQFTAAMVNGDIAPLEAWLDARHGRSSFIIWR